MADTIIALLKEDHRKVSDILEKLADTTERAVKTRQDAFLTLKSELKLHEKFEEEIFYPAIKAEATKKSGTQALVLEAYQEHHVVDMLMTEMEKLTFSDEDWTAKLTVLKENLEHHIHEEEDNLFPQVKNILTDEAMKDMATELKTWKEAA